MGPDHDALTGLPNRTLLRDLLSRAIANCSRDNRPLALLMLSIGDFHELKEVLGYVEGDKVVQEVARRAVRELLPADIVARMDDDLFAVVLPEAAADRATAVAEVLLRSLSPLIYRG